MILELFVGVARVRRAVRDRSVEEGVDAAAEVAHRVLDLATQRPGAWTEVQEDLERAAVRLAQKMVDP